MKKSVIILFTLNIPKSKTEKILHKNNSIIYSSAYTNTHITNFIDLESFNHELQIEYKKELEEKIKKNKEVDNENIFLLNDYYINILSLPFKEKILKKITELHPNANITVITDQYQSNIYLKNRFKNKQFTFLYLQSNIIKKVLDLANYFFSLNKVLFVIKNLVILCGMLTKIFYISLKYILKKKEKEDILFLSWSIKFFKKIKNIHIDSYYHDMFKKLKNKSIATYCVTTDFSSFSFYKYLNFLDIIKLTYKTLKRFLITLELFNTTFLPFSNDIMLKIINLEALILFLSKTRTKGIIYYGEFTMISRPISFAANSLNIPTFGLQYGFIKQKHDSAIKNIFLEKYNNLYFPKYFLVYGEYSKSIIESNTTSYINRIFKIGMPISNINNTPNKKNKSLLIVSPSNKDEFDHDYKQIKELEGVLFNTISLRPHPGWGEVFVNDKNYTKKMFFKNYKDIKLINVKEETIDTSIETHDYILFLSQSTTILNAILQRKVVIVLERNSEIKFHDYTYWGAQVVPNINEIDWTKKANPKNVLKEITPQDDIIEIIKDKIKGNEL